jgi:trehalose synthase
MNEARNSDLWWMSAVYYCLDIETFYDGNGDGIGDIGGLVERIDHLDQLGVTCLWLMPFYPSPNLDDGYDITDYYAVDPHLGSLGDLVVLIRAAKGRGLRVIVDLVVNHTSDRHPWFRSARARRDSPFRDFYVWRDDAPPTTKDAVVFPDAEDSIWSYDERAGQYYLHHFYSHQPDLNIANPAVRDEICKVAGFWLELGVDGFRVDAVPFLVETGELPDAPELDPHELLRDIRAFISRRRGDACLLGEVNLPPDELVTYFGQQPGDEIQVMFNFPVMQATFLALARCDARPLADAIAATPPKPSGCQWANFLRNHDELTLDQLSDSERQEVFDAFGSEEHMQLFGRGLRRRVPPMFGGDEARVRMAYSLMLSLPGAPVLFYGEEIGMGENLDIEGRLSVRTPMQWTPGTNGGFSTARRSRLRRPLPDGRYGPLAVNVAEQRRDDRSMLTWMEQLIRRRRQTPELSWGDCEVLDTGHPGVFAHRCAGPDRTVIAVHNLSAEPCEIAIPIDEEHDQVTDLLEGDAQPWKPDDGLLRVTFGPYAFRWFTTQPASAQRSP